MRYWLGVGPVSGVVSLLRQRVTMSISESSRSGHLSGEMSEAPTQGLGMERRQMTHSITLEDGVAGEDQDNNSSALPY